MIKNILVIGGHGMLGKPVVGELLKAGFKVRALAREVEKVKVILPGEVEIMPGDLRDVESIRKAADGMEAVYMNLNTKNPNADFRPELEGVLNVLEALKDRPEVVVSKIGGLLSGSISPDEVFPNAQQRIAGERTIKDSGNPYLLFHPTWFYESLPMMVQKGKYLMIGKPGPVYWLAAEDYGRMIVSAFNKGITNKVYTVQGKEAISFKDAGRRFFDIYDPSVKFGKIPLVMMKVMGWLKPELSTVYHLIKVMMKYPEKQVSEETWAELGEPIITIEDYANNLKKGE